MTSCCQLKNSQKWICPRGWHDPARLWDPPPGKEPRGHESWVAMLIFQITANFSNCSLPGDGPARELVFVLVDTLRSQHWQAKTWHPSRPGAEEQQRSNGGIPPRVPAQAERDRALFAACSLVLCSASHDAQLVQGSYINGQHKRATGAF